jgi:hypothetical protein
MININFKQVDEDVDIGINDAGFETFSHSKRIAIARELSQNSGDAGVEDLRPVEIDFNLENIKTSEFPDIKNFRRNINECISDNKKNKRSDAVEALEEAKKTLDEDYLKLLIVSDRNTTGVKGPFNKGTPFFTLLKSKGVSVKPDENAAGSFGIGKNAPFAVTPLRTVFYASRFENKDGESEYLTMGKTVLTSFKDSNSSFKDSEGFWGNDGKPICEMSNLPKWLHKEDNGLKVIIPGFEIDDPTEWIWSFTLILIINFFTAIIDKRISFNLNQKQIKINAETIKTLFYKEELKNASINLNYKTELKQAQKFFEVLTSPDKHSSIVNINNFGKFKIEILLSDDGLKKVLFTRNGICIANSLAHHKLKHFQETSGFYAIVRPEQPYGEASKNLRELETPQHNAFSIDRIRNNEKRKIFRQGIDKLHNEIRVKINAIAGIKYDKISQLDELNKYFLGTDNLGSNANTQASPGIDKGKKLIPVSKTVAKNSFTPGGDTGGSEPGGGSGNGANGGSGGGQGGFDTDSDSGLGSGSGSLRSIQIPVDRFFVTNNDYSKRIVTLNPPQKGKLQIMANSIGFDGEEVQLEIINTNIGEVHGGVIEIKLEKEGKTRVELTLSEEYNGPSKVKCTLETDSI